ncbi:uncharacterized protein LOC122373061, partial [Amphibalanus amphitrite]|uniref:uncharacterized protein LOC122373061 n=1 Tax=Amphibalanus amphitrite TaxID=1232801 RepID=UPI001C92B186
MVVSGEKTQVLVLSQWPKDAVDLSIRVAGARVEARETLNLLGVTLDRLLHFGPHCKRMRQRTRPRLQHLRRLTGRDWGLEERQLRIVANGYVRGALEHAAAAWLPAASPSHVEVLEREMREAARVITGCTRSTPTEALMAEAGLAPVTARKTTLAARFLAKCATWAWTDGSATGGVLDGGAGGYIEWPDGESHELRAPAGKLCSSYRAEMVALRETLNYIGNHTDHEEDPIILCTDSQAALSALRSGPAEQRTQLNRAVWDALALVSDNGERQVLLQWVPSHCGLPGNEMADSLAKEAASLPQEQ